MVDDVVVRSKRQPAKRRRFAPTPWTSESEQWQALDRRLPQDHLARRIDRMVDELDLGPLLDTYFGVGKKALRPDSLLKLVLYEMQNKRPSPAQWAKDVRESEPVRWLLFGLEPSRARLYDFRERIAPFFFEWNAQALQMTLENDMTEGSRVALDGTAVAAHASRRRHLLNEERLQKRREAIDERLQQAQRGALSPPKPGWLASTKQGLQEQQRRYRHAAAVLRKRQQANGQKRSSKRKPPEKILVSATDPDAVLARDKDNVFRPMYNVQLLRDLDSPLIFGYGVFAQNNDNDTLEPMLERMLEAVGRKPKALLADSGYASLRDVELCVHMGITLYAPCQENDYSRANNKKPQRNQHTTIPKSAFPWLEAEQVYQCPEGHRMPYTRKQEQQRSGYTVTLRMYQCPGEHCRNCPRQASCTGTSKNGRSVSRMEGEEWLDELRRRMQTDEAKQLYKLRSQTVELNYADMKEHRDMRRFRSRGLNRVEGELGAMVLAHNLLAIDHHDGQQRRTRPADATHDEAIQNLYVA